jgi:hypothetical protein
MNGAAEWEASVFLPANVRCKFTQIYANLCKAALHVQKPAKSCKNLQKWKAAADKITFFA